MSMHKSFMIGSSVEARFKLNMCVWVYAFVYKNIASLQASSPA